MYGVVGILTALTQREKTGRGQVIDVSMFESILSWPAYFPHHYWHRGKEAEQVGMRHHFMTPYGPYLASDGVLVNMAVATPQDWELLCRRVIEQSQLLEDRRFQTSENRRKNRAVLEPILEEIFRQRPHQEWLQCLEEARLPHGLVRNIGQVLTHPQVAARKMVAQVDSPGGPVPVIASPRHLSDSPERLDPIPALGQDNAAILRELGYSTAQIEEIQSDRVI